MPANAVVIGVDSSTQSTKAAFTDVTSGRLLAVGRASHRVTGEHGARETDPEVWWQALADAVAAGLKELAGLGIEPAAVTGIAVAGQQHGLVVLDRAGAPCGPHCCGTTPAPRRRPPLSPRRSAGPTHGPPARAPSPSPP